MDWETHRDEQCAEDVAEMARLGRFDKEYIAYGCAEFQADGQVVYHAANDGAELEQYLQKKAFNGSYLTLFSQQSKRSSVPAGYDEVFKQSIKFSLLSEMKAAYAKIDFFPKMKEFFQVPANNLGLEYLRAYQEKIDGYFELDMLQIFHGLVTKAYEGKILKQESFVQLNNWYEKIINQMSDDPVAVDNLTRTFYGFVYWDGQKYDCFIDAKRFPVLEQYQLMVQKGYIVGSIAEKKYFFKQFSQMPSMRKQFRQWLLALQNEAYFALLKEMKQIPGVIAKDKIISLADEFAAYDVATATFRYYQNIWNEQ